MIPRANNVTRLIERLKKKGLVTKRPEPSDRLALVGDAGRLRSLGWQPAHPFEETLKDLLEDWRSRV